MKIALDYDGTYTEDPIMWDEFVRMATHMGHEITCVTMRYPHETVPDIGVPVFYTSRKAKSKAFAADIWIDDKPQWLLMDSV